MIKLGVLVIIAAVIFLVVPLLSPDVLKPLAPVFCGPNETLNTETSTFSMPGETRTSFYYYCVDSEGGSREITDTMTLVLMGGFIVLLLGGMLLTFVGAARKAKDVTNTVGDVVTALQSRQGTPVIVGDGQVGQILGNDFADLINQIKTMKANGQPISLENLKSGGFHIQMGGEERTLTETLQQLEDAHKQGLISDDEFQRLRTEALDKLV